MFKPLVMGTLATVLIVPTALADEKQAETCLRTKVWDQYAEGYAIRTMTTTTLAAGSTRNYLVTLYKGNEYQIQGCGDDSAQNLDLILYNLDGNKVLQDTSTDKEPGFTYKPEQTGTFYIVVHARQLTAGQNDTGVAVAVTYR